MLMAVEHMVWGAGVVLTRMYLWAMMMSNILHLIVLQELCTGSPGLEPTSIVPTVGLNVGRVEAHHAQLLFWDLGGQAGLRSIWDKYFADSHALIFVVDSTRPARCAAWPQLPATVGAAGCWGRSPCIWSMCGRAAVLTDIVDVFRPSRRGNFQRSLMQAWYSRYLQGSVRLLLGIQEGSASSIQDAEASVCSMC